MRESHASPSALNYAKPCQTPITPQSRSRFSYAEEGLPIDVTVPSFSSSSDTTRVALFPGAVQEVQTAVRVLR